MKILKRPEGDLVKELTGLGYDKLSATILSSRLTKESDLDKFLNLTKDSMDDYKLLADIQESSELIYKHMADGNHIALVVDYDLDGCTSGSVLYKMFTEAFDYKNVTIMINKRAYGNGINNTLFGEIRTLHSTRPIHLIITADHGSSSEKNIKRCRDLNIDFCLTDHHLLPEDNYPVSANVVVNPQRKDCGYDKSISGCCVAYLTMLNLEDYLMTKNWRNLDERYREILLPIVAVSTIGDSMRLNSPTNRYIVTKGLKIMNTLEEPIWRALYKFTGMGSNITERDLAFNFNPLLNAASRIGDPFIAFNFLICTKFTDAGREFKNMTENNLIRKTKQNDLMEEANKYLITTKHYDFCTVPLVEEGLGINGIISSMLGDTFGKPIVTFTYSNDRKTLGGSGRSIVDDFNMRDGYEAIWEKNKDKFIQFGGHAGAAGCTIKPDFLEDFKEHFNKEVKKQLNGNKPEKTIYFDHELPKEEIDMGLVKHISTLGPFGMKFPEVIFKTEFKVLKSFTVGKKKEHIKLTLDSGLDTPFEAFFIFGNRSGEFTGRRLDKIDLYYSLGIKNYNGLHIDLAIKSLVPKH